MSAQPSEGVAGDVRFGRAAPRSLALPESARTLLRQKGFLVFMLAAYALAMLLVPTSSVPPDAWLGVVAGREIVSEGLPHTDSLTVLGAGRAWIDQQWLAHTAFYGLYATGGMTLIILVNALLGVVAVGVGMAVAAARGASVRATGWIAVVAMIPFLPFAVTPRAQSLVYVLFVLAAALLLADGRRPSSRVLLILPLLVAWANLHGSVVLMALLVTGHAALQLRRRRWQPPVVAVLAWASVFASPYAADLPAYYRSTLANPAFAAYVTEWQATTLSPATLPFFLLVGGALWMAGRSQRRLTGTEAWLLLATAAAGFATLRNVVWFALVALMVLPPLVDGTLAGRTWSGRFNRLTGLAGAVLLAVAAVAVLSHPHPGRFPDAAAAAVAEAAGDEAPVYVDQRYADWLLAVDDRFVGRVAFDGRFEILDAETLDEIIYLRLRAVDLERFTRRYRVFVLDRAGDAPLVEALARAGFTRRYEYEDYIVLASDSRRT